MSVRGFGLEVVGRPTTLRLWQVGNQNSGRGWAVERNLGKICKDTFEELEENEYCSNGYGVLPIFENIKYLTTKSKLYFSVSDKTGLASHLIWLLFSEPACSSVEVSSSHAGTSCKVLSQTLCFMCQRLTQFPLLCHLLWTGLPWWLRR